MKHLAVAAAVTAILCGGSPALADESDDASDALATMAAATVCKISVSEEAKRGLYGKILNLARTPSQVTYEIEKEIEALNKLSYSDRTGCAWQLKTV
jgi:hypothetical protein